MSHPEISNYLILERGDTGTWGVWKSCQTPWRGCQTIAGHNHTLTHTPQTIYTSQSASNTCPWNEEGNQIISSGNPQSTGRTCKPHEPPPQKCEADMLTMPPCSLLPCIVLALLAPSIQISSWNVSNDMLWKLLCFVKLFVLLYLLRYTHTHSALQ